MFRVPLQTWYINLDFISWHLQEKKKKEEKRKEIERARGEKFHYIYNERAPATLNKYSKRVKSIVKERVGAKPQIY